MELKIIIILCFILFYLYLYLNKTKIKGGTTNNSCEIINKILYTKNSHIGDLEKITKQYSEKFYKEAGYAKINLNNQLNILNKRNINNNLSKIIKQIEYSKNSHIGDLEKIVKQNSDALYKEASYAKQNLDNQVKKLNDTLISIVEIHIKNNTTGVYLHSNRAEYGGFSLGGKSRDFNWNLVFFGCLTDKTLVHFQSKSSNNNNKYWLSSESDGHRWSYTKASDKTWSLIKLNGNNNYAIKNNYIKSFIASNKVVENGPINYTSSIDESNWIIEFV